MKMDTSFKAVFASMMIVSGLAACDKPGPAQTAGKQIDQATENVSSTVASNVDKANSALTKQEKGAVVAMDDTQITAKVKTAFYQEPGLKSMKISVNTEKGIVTLSGFVDTAANKEKAYKLAESADGVKSVTNQLVISK
jgi:hyperosmotically inducible periplasmic protein